MKSPAARKSAVLFTVERRTVVGEVHDGGDKHPIAAGLEVVAEVVCGALERLHRPITDEDPAYPTDPSYVTDTLTFQWAGHDITVNVEPITD